MAEVARELLMRGERGDAEAQLALGRHYESHGETRMARAWFARAAKAGRIDAITALGANLLSHKPVSEGEGIAMMQMAAQNGEARAAYVCGVLAAQNRNNPDRWALALACLDDAAKFGLAGAADELALLTGGAPDAFREDDFASALPLEEASAAPRIGFLRGCLRPELCDWLIAQNRPHLVRATVYDATSGGSRVEGARSNSNVIFDLLHTSFVVTLLRTRIAASLAAPIRLEPTVLLHYNPGEEFTPHFDFLDPNVPAYAREIATDGQRIATCLVYLNEDYEGGETDFSKIGLPYKGKKGDALVFWNVDASGNPDPLSFHAGRPPTSGEKWIISQWIREPARRTP